MAKLNLSIALNGFSGLAGGALIIGSLFYGPIDLGRMGFNAVFGEYGNLKKELIEYNLLDLKYQYPSANQRELELVLADKVKADWTRESGIESSSASMYRLFDESEDRARTFGDRWIWTSL